MTNQSLADREAIRVRVHAMWAGVAPHWADHAGEVDERAAVLTERMLHRAAPRAGDRVLELACGPGGAGLAAAERVGPSGEVVLSDVAAEMTSIAAARAAAQGIVNVRTATLDLEAIEQPDASYDVVLCREGLMFAVEPGRAVAEIRRVLRPGGRVAVSVWGPPAQNPWLAVALDAVAATVGTPVPPTHVPGPFALDDPARLAGLLAIEGFSDIGVEDVPVALHCPTFEAWWARTQALAGPLAGVVARLAQDAKADLAERLRAAVEPYLTAGGIEFPGAALLASARR
jgi:SAM-dependent methyltransferase